MIQDIILLKYKKKKTINSYKVFFIFRSYII